MTTLTRLITSGNALVGGELFDHAWSITYTDPELARALIQELGAILFDINEKNNLGLNLDQMLLDNIKEWHNELL